MMRSRPRQAATVRTGNLKAGVPCAAALAALAAAALLAGCSASVTTGGDTLVQSSEVAYAQSYISKQLTDMPATKSVSCPSGVDAKVGNTFECQATLTNGQKVTLPFRVDSISGKHVALAANFAQVSPAVAIDSMYKGTASLGVQSVDCPSGVPATVGKTFDCQVHLENGRTLKVTLRIDNATATDQSLSAVHAS
jgi:uncharacterized protein DUF4333